MKESKRLPGIEIYNHLKLGNFVQFEYEEERFPGEVPQLDPKKKRLKINAMAMAGVKKDVSNTMLVTCQPTTEAIEKETCLKNITLH
ncbi:hypothetical protein QYM36_011829 [Artemia franciscana]|uniref:Uncharacterized protein n=1 Tax=Artemia franciscana TaxID=6661 RepID=A0AA88HHK6_ARTSF|nr:hypothetical protein QYM36_011829 [Artemia franciscana]